MFLVCLGLTKSCIYSHLPSIWPPGEAVSFHVLVNVPHNAPRERRGKSPCWRITCLFSAPCERERTWVWRRARATVCGGKWPDWAEVPPERRLCSSDGQPSEPPEPHLRGPDPSLWFYPKLKTELHKQEMLHQWHPVSRSTNTENGSISGMVFFLLFVLSFFNSISAYFYLLSIYVCFFYISS